MKQKLAIDFGTTNSVIARWDAESETAIVLESESLSNKDPSRALPPLIPSLVYIENGTTGDMVFGEIARQRVLIGDKDKRLFRNFKRGLVVTPAPEPRNIDGVLWSNQDVGSAFIRRLVDSLPYGDSEIEQLVVTAPLAAFEGYLQWLNTVINTISPEKVRIVDESTAAALGYNVTEPEAVVLVFDFGGGTLDLSLVQLPADRSRIGGFLSRLRLGESKQHTAKVIAKAGRAIGGSDVDQWLVQDFLQRTGLTAEQLGSDYAALLSICEETKISLSEAEDADLRFDAAGQTHTLTITRDELEALMERNGFYGALRRVVDKVMHVARQRGIFKEDIHYILLVGGTSLMPSVQRALGQYFTDMAVRADKPFTAVAEGALQVAAGYGLEDHLVHSYGLRYLAEGGEHDFDEIIPTGSSYPTNAPVEIVLGAAHPEQTQVEFVIGEIDTDAVTMVEVKYESGQAIFVAQATDSDQRIVLMNEVGDAKMLAQLDPPGTPDEDRLTASFRVDERRQLRVTVTDLLTAEVLLDDVAVVTLR